MSRPRPHRPSLRWVAWLAVAGAFVGALAAALHPPRPADPPGPPPPHFDLLIKGGEVVDGSGSEPFRADVGIVGDRIAAVGDLTGASARRVLSVAGRYVAPGFVNPHSHIDGALDADRDVAASLLQGITTELVGLDGEAPVDTAAYLERLEAGGGIGVNVAVLAGHGAIRRAVMGHEPRPATALELARMQGWLREALQAGALGMSTGLEYVPGRYAPTDELVELSRTLAAHGRLYVTHLRNERDRVVAAVQEALRIGREADVTVLISHIKVARKPGWPADTSALVQLAHQVVALIEQAREAGQPVYADLYPYPVPWYLTRREFSRAYPAYPLETLEPVVPALQEGGGRTLTQWAHSWGISPQEAVARLRRQYGDFPVAIHSVEEEVIRLLLSRPFTMVSVDAPSPGDPRWGGVGHPRGFGTYPRVLRRYVREERLLTWGQAVRKMSGLAAQVLGLERRGLVRPGYFADLVVFDPATVADRATYAHPRLPPAGIEYVIVNGQVAVENGRLVRPGGGQEAAPPGQAEGPGVRAGRVLRWAGPAPGARRRRPPGRRQADARLTGATPDPARPGPHPPAR